MLARIEAAVDAKETGELQDWRTEAMKTLCHLDPGAEPKEYAVTQGRFDELDFFVNPGRFEKSVRDERKRIHTEVFTND